MRRVAAGLWFVLGLVLATPTYAACDHRLDFGRFPIDSLADRRLPVVAACRAEGECAFIADDGVRYLAAAFEPKAAPRIVRKTIDRDWRAAPFGLRPGDSVDVVLAKLRRGGVGATPGRTHDGRPAISTTCAIRGVDLHFDALFTPTGRLTSLSAGVETPAD